MGWVVVVASLLAGREEMEERIFDSMRSEVSILSLSISRSTWRRVRARDEVHINKSTNQFTPEHTLPFRPENRRLRLLLGRWTNQSRNQRKCKGMSLTGMHLSKNFSHKPQAPTQGTLLPSSPRTRHRADFCEMCDMRHLLWGLLLACVFSGFCSSREMTSD